MTDDDRAVLAAAMARLAHVPLAELREALTPPDDIDITLPESVAIIRSVYVQSLVHTWRAVMRSAAWICLAQVAGAVGAVRYPALAPAILLLSGGWWLAVFAIGLRNARRVMEDGT